jgi:hypothetical protein
MHQALISYTHIAAIRNYKNTCKKLYDNVHFHMASDYTIANMATVTCLRGLIAFAQQQDQMSVKPKDSTCDNIQKNFMRFLSRSDIKERLTTELVLQRIENRMTIVLNKECLFSAIDLETSEQKTLFQDTDAQDIATKLILYSQYYDPSSMYDNNKSPLLINMFKSDKKNLWPLLLAHPRVDVNLQDTDGNTTLMTACTHNIEAVKILLAEQNVNVNLQNKFGHTALMLACACNYIEIVKQLLADQKVDVNLQDIWGDTALMKACEYNRREIVKILLAHQHMWPLDKIIYNLYLKYGLSAAKIIVLLGTGIILSSLLLGLLYYAH